WDIRSGSERQLDFERRTYLFSTLLTFVFVIQLAALLLFVFNADRLSAMFVGAMCAVGTLNVNDFGFPSLITQMVVFFLAAMWLAINHVDTRAPDYPLVKIKYGLLILLLPVMALSFWLELQYFLGLKANVITSCCGSLFSGDAKTIAGEASGMEPKPALFLFYGVLVLAIGSALWHWKRGVRLSGYVLAGASGAAFVAAIIGVLSFISLYIYEHPHHHCPFCILKPEYDYQGYWLYLPLFVATAAGLGAGAMQPFARVASLRHIIPKASARLAGLAAGGYILFTLVATYFVIASNLILIEH
ncbi:MAG: hypothetical protein PHV02_18280, partial [Rhodocyclaceae bacterium]|nr:hypothetical protein [Rhodocyclaceae bacterium]